MIESNRNVDIENESVINDLIIEHLTNSGVFEKLNDLLRKKIIKVQIYN